MERRNFIVNFLLWILAFFFGYTVSNKNENDRNLNLSKSRTYEKGKLYASDFNTKGDGITDDTTAIDNLIQSAIKSVTRDASLSNNYFGNVEVVFPAGTFIYKGKNLFSTAAFRTIGLKISGAGKGATRIIYKPEGSGDFMFVNPDKLLHLTFEDMSFYGNNNNNFMLSISSGGAQNYIFNRVTWNNWNKVLELRGENTNSEMTWNSCNFNGIIKKGLFVGGTDTSDQFVNFNFFSCNFEVSEGDFIDMSKGGNINIWGGSFIHYGGETGGAFFKFQGGSHAYGVQRFLCIGARFEHRYVGSELIHCGWGSGAVSFINCDMGVNAFSVPNTAVTAKFFCGNDKLPMIKFDNCVLMGKHEYHYNITAWKFPHNIIYENCEIMQHDKANTFISYIAESGHTNRGGRPIVKFRNCRGGLNNNKKIWDTDHNFHTVNRGTLSSKVIALKSADGKFPTTGGKEEIYLPLNAVITRIILASPANAVTSFGPYDFRVKTFEASPTELLVASGPTHALGFNAQLTTPFICDTDEKSHLKLEVITADQPNPKAVCLIEYIG
jgi:hypothetical protein